MDTYNQLWLLLKQYIGSAEKRSGNHNRKSVISWACLLEVRRSALMVQCFIHPIRHSTLLSTWETLFDFAVMPA
jgi:hypothetical protein